MPSTRVLEASPSTCPVAHRRVRPETDESGPALERAADDRWVIRSADLARQVLREAGAVQAGFSAEQATRGLLREEIPVLYAHGEPHRRQRSRIARFFTPRTVDSRYRELMEREVEHAVSALRGRGPVALDQVALRYSVAVAREVVGLTDSPVDGLTARLEAFCAPIPAHPGRVRGTWHHARMAARLSTFWLLDVRPAARARQVHPRDDVLSHLVAEGRKRQSLLTECLTYGAAGMVTTREFIVLATWQMLRDPGLRRRFLDGDEKARHHILTELLRVDPVVSGLRRRLEKDVLLEHEGAAVHLPAGSVVEIPVRRTNTDPAVVGDDPERVDPDRPSPRGFKDDVLGFGEGVHRCPGAFIAIQETDLLLVRLLALPLELVREPDVSFNEMLGSYVLRDMQVRCAPGGDAPTVPECARTTGWGS